ncbi:type II toxin-antitoxin system RelE/ParE family toxin [Woodsholea maritima]|uniref:type II toxin-antitoxin system RelE/ParE family toxin n=1 Tax=Woodsholea maritima TaxID=240237 RepID=UPI000A00777D|nr:type II toxin-antitoxin system RelE/ParE family toxin [Woodsholea maritima]
MTRKALVLTRPAARDLDTIYDHIAEDNPNAAARFIHGLVNKIQWIVERDYPGLNRDHVREGLRACLYKKRCIYFLNEDTRIVIVRILHGARDIETAFGEG